MNRFTGNHAFANCHENTQESLACSDGFVSVSRPSPARCWSGRVLQKQLKLFSPGFSRFPIFFFRAFPPVIFRPRILRTEKFFVGLAGFC